MVEKQKTLNTASMASFDFPDIRRSQLCRRSSGISMVKEHFLKIVLFGIFVLLAFNSQAQQNLNNQVVVVKSNQYGIVFEVKIHKSNEIVDFNKYTRTGGKIKFTNIKDILDYLEVYGYELTNSIQLAAAGQIDSYVYVQYVFTLKPGSHPVLKI